MDGSERVILSTPAVWLRMCFAYAHMSVSRFVAMRAKALMDLSSVWFTMGANMLLWYALYVTQGITSIQGYAINDMLWYLIVVAVTEAIINHPYQAQEQMHDIHEGMLNTYLLKPLHPFWIWYVQNMSKKVIMYLIFGLPFLILFVWNADNLSTALFRVFIWTLALMCGGTLRFLLFSTVALLTFWIGLSWGWTFILRVAMTMASGAFLPLSFFPDAVRSVIEVLPFQFVGYVPAQLLLGRLSGAALMHTMSIGVIWLVILILGWTVLYRRGSIQYEAYGG